MTTSPPRRRSTTVEESATPCTRSTAPTPWSAAARRSTSTPRSRRHRDNKVIIPIVLLVVLLILVLLLRAMVAPLLLIGDGGAVVRRGARASRRWSSSTSSASPGRIRAFPLFAFVFLVALGIDYNIFLMTRVREETAHHGTRRGSLIALSSTGGVITSAGLVLAATFLVLGDHAAGVPRRARLTVALGVLLDTMIVRSVLVTALNLDLGGRIWWPSKLDPDWAPVAQGGAGA